MSPFSYKLEIDERKKHFLFFSKFPKYHMYIFFYMFSCNLSIYTYIFFLATLPHQYKGFPNLGYFKGNYNLELISC